MRKKKQETPRQEFNRRWEELSSRDTWSCQYVYEIGAWRLFQAGMRLGKRRALNRRTDHADV